MNSPQNEDGTAERILELYGAIAEESWLDDDITPKMFRDELMNGSGNITVWINSPGGDCVAAAQIYNMLMDYPHDVTIKIDALAASAASVIAMAGTKVLMSPTALMMIHNPLTVAMGDSEEMQKAIDMLAEVKESIINAYEIKTGMSRVKIARLMDAETWMNARKAVELGFCDGLLFTDKDEEDEDDDETTPDEKQDETSPDEKEEDQGDEPEKKKAPDNSFVYSRKAAQDALLAKITAKNTVNKKTGTDIEVLEQRLRLLKP